MTMPVVLERADRVPPRRRAAARVAVVLAALVIRLRPRFLRRFLRAVSRGARPATITQAQAARDAVVSVSVRCAGQGCLQRSVATVLLCRLSGTWPDWCTGVMTQPFRAHAWVEVAGVSIGEGTGMPPFHKVMTVSVEG
ncbi:lasso peptide biosynthesis B2 protein [Actinomadura macra]|uniref:lasso peptide biosynthesis B2 protein n=1 Tax=Actinomadura macra TaxID=46164 RepID=UPI000829F7F8|nr:lasso peptide biosynthesis B2 protein [Actinomadura macra]